mmetsp:Transcript_6420/g.7808  ORF Transcript_6420/g.7808 Transcript_6420/m.7808 type:complete len:223 (+) Transcript_6420:1-669(+)
MAMAKNNQVPQIIDKLEDYFASPEHTSAIGDFLSLKVSEFTHFNPKEEQPLHYYQIFGEYQKLVETSVESFLVQEGKTNEELFNTISQFQGTGGSEIYTCIDYLVACTEYDYFLQLMEDMKRMDDWGGWGDEGDESLELSLAEPKLETLEDVRDQNHSKDDDNIVLGKVHDIINRTDGKVECLSDGVSLISLEKVVSRAESKSEEKSAKEEEEISKSICNKN